MSISVVVDKHVNFSLFVGCLLHHEQVAHIPIPPLAREIEQQVRAVAEDANDSTNLGWYNWWREIVGSREHGLEVGNDFAAFIGTAEPLASVTQLCRRWFDEWWDSPVGARLALEYLVQGGTQSSGIVWPRSTRTWLIDVVFPTVDEELYVCDGYAIVGVPVVASKSRFQGWLNAVVGASGDSSAN